MIDISTPCLKKYFKIDNVEDSNQSNSTEIIKDITNDEPYNFDNSYKITSKDEQSILEQCLSLMNEFIENNPKSIAQENFTEDLKDNVFNILMLTFSQVNNIELDYIVNNIINYAEELFYSSVIPRRSMKNQVFCYKKDHNKKIKKKLNYLKNLPQPEQRTDEWYKTRHNLITASNAWKCLDTESNKNNIIYEKCKDIDVNKYNNVNINSPMHHGVKYEPLTTLFYELKHNLKVDDFGCIIHKDYKFLGASPDGIVTDINSTRYGRMLEIKNVVNRKITGIPKKEYWIQMQLQMETCKLNECDFLETRFTEYEDSEQYINDDSYRVNDLEKLKGKILYFIKDEKPFYVYPDLRYTENEYLSWENSMMEKYKDLTWVKTIYWKLEEVSCVLVLRNKFWFNNIIQEIEEIWKTIEKERVTGFSHRIAKKRDVKPAAQEIIITQLNNSIKTNISQNISNTNNTTKTQTIKKPICLISIDTETM